MSDLKEKFLPGQFTLAGMAGADAGHRRHLRGGIYSEFSDASTKVSPLFSRETVAPVQYLENGRY